MVVQRGGKSGQGWQQSIQGKRVRKTGRRRSMKKNEYCKKREHTMEQCFKLNGEPDWFEDLKNEKTENGGKRIAGNVQAEMSDDDDDCHPLGGKALGRQIQKW